MATDRQSVSQTSAFRSTQVTSAIQTKAGTTVSAAGAQGVVVAKIRFDKTKLLTKRRLGVVVTIKDRRGYLIRGAALHLKGMPLRYFAAGADRASFTNRVGQKRFSYLLKKSAFTTSGVDSRSWCAPTLRGRLSKRRPGSGCLPSYPPDLAARWARLRTRLPPTPLDDYRPVADGPVVSLAQSVARRSSTRCSTSSSGSSRRGVAGGALRLVRSWRERLMLRLVASDHEH